MQFSITKPFQFASIVMLTLLSCTSFTSLQAQVELDEQVPYQGDALLTNPNQVRETAEGEVLMDCDWSTMMSMIRDLEERIASEMETDPVYDIYVSGEMVGNVLHMWHDCAVLRDSIVSLQNAYNAALANPFSCGTSKVTFDGYDYATVQIDDQCWFAENLRTQRYAENSIIPELEDAAEWSADTDGAQVIYDNDPVHLADYGRLYNWYAVNNQKGLCPTGWSVPSKATYQSLIDYLGGEEVAGGKLKAAPSDSIPWDGTNDYGFTMVDGGGRQANGDFILHPDNGFLRTSTAHPNEITDAFTINFLDVYDDGALSVQDPKKGIGASVRCIKDAE